MVPSITVPKIFHHYWTSDNIFRPQFHAYRFSFMYFNPDYTFYWWDLKNAPYDLMLPDSVKLLKSGLPYVMKSDIFRWELLRLFGGIIVDTDVQCMKNFDPLLDTESFCAKGHRDNPYCNAIVGSVPGNPLIERILIATHKAIINNWETANSRESWKCGVIVAANLLGECTTILPVEAFCPFSWVDVEYHTDRVHTNYPDAYTIHWWTGIQPCGWGEEADKVKAMKLPLPPKPF